MFDSSAILLYLAETTGQLQGSPDECGELLSWLFYIAADPGHSRVRPASASNCPEASWRRIARQVTVFGNGQAAGVSSLVLLVGCCNHCRGGRE